MKPFLPLFALAGALVSSLAFSAQADEAVPREHHPWGRFKTGSWKKVRVITETLDAQGKVLSMSKTETKLTLLEKTGSDYVLQVDVSVEVAGRRITSKPQYVRQGFNGEAEGQRLISLKKLGPGEVVVNGRTIPSDVRQVIVNGGDQKRTTTLHYCSDIEPYVLKRETNTTDAAGQTTLSQNVVEVLALEMPQSILDEVKTVSHVKTIHSRAGGKTITLETHCLDVPGTVVSHSLKEQDEAGNIVRRSTLELVDYELGDGRDDEKNRRRGLFNRRNRKPAPARS